jgi:hypothetical protein
MAVKVAEVAWNTVREVVDQMSREELALIVTFNYLAMAADSTGIDVRLLLPEPQKDACLAALLKFKTINEGLQETR